MNSYFAGPYFHYLLWLTAGYFAVWMLGAVLARLAYKGSLKGNPLPGIFTSWITSLGVHTLIVVLLSIITFRDMGTEGIYNIYQFLLYNLGFFIMFIINWWIILHLLKAKKNIRF